MTIKNNTLHNISGVILEILHDTADFLPRPFESPYAHLKRVRSLPYRKYYDTVKRLQSRGVLTVSEKNGKKFIQLTSKGQLEVLFKQAQLSTRQSWDGEWRMIIFDIPENARQRRDQLRRLLKLNGYYGLQDSVFISPYPLNRQAVEYLNKSGLRDYIRILLIAEMDDDADLRKRFKLSR